jgi:hypothetical protein
LGGGGRGRENEKTLIELMKNPLASSPSQVFCFVFSGFVFDI